MSFIPVLLNCLIYVIVLNDEISSKLTWEFGGSLKGVFPLREISSSFWQTDCVVLWHIHPLIKCGNKLRLNSILLETYFHY